MEKEYSVVSDKFGDRLNEINKHIGTFGEVVGEWNKIYNLENKFGQNLYDNGQFKSAVVYDKENQTEYNYHKL